MTNKIIKSKFGAAVLSVIIAFGLWWYVVTNVSQETEHIFQNVPVIMEGESVLTERNMMITYTSADSVDLTLYGTRSNLAKVNSGNITLKADLTKIYEPGERIPLTYNTIFPADVASNALTPVNRNPDNIYVTVEYRRQKEVPVEIQWVGSTPEGYMSDRENRILDHTAVTVIGPASLADQIAKAVITVDLNNQKESISQDYKFTLCNDQGEPVEAEDNMIHTSITEVHLDVKIRRVKEITLTVDVVYGGGATEHNTIVTVDPGMIRVSGGEALLEEMGDTISLGRIDLSSINESQEMTFPIPLPDGIVNLSNITEAMVNIQFYGLDSREILVSNLIAENVPEGLVADIIEKKLTIVLRGPIHAVAAIEPEDITIVADFTDAVVGTSTFKAIIQLPEEFQVLGPVGSYSVTANIREQTEEDLLALEEAGN